MGEMMYRNRVILRGMGAARGVLSGAYDFDSRTEEPAIQPIQALRPREFGAPPRDKDIMDSSPIAHVVLGKRVDFARSPIPVGVRPPEYASAEASHPVRKDLVGKPDPAPDIGCVQRGVAHLVL